MRLRSVVAAVALAAMSACGPSSSSPPPRVESAPAAAPPVKSTSAGLVRPEQRAAALKAARVWQQPAVSIADANLKANPPGPGAFDSAAIIDCRLVVKPMSGTTPKFDCELPGKDVVRVKYGRGNPELHAEIAGTRLLSALGFGADRTYVVRQVRCAGCTAFPFHSLLCLAQTKLEQACFPRGINYSTSSNFDYVTIERRFEGRRVEATPDQGWAWYELDRIDAKAGGSPRAHVDALKLLAVVIAHWDNKAENQRLLCLPGGDMPDGGCSKPYAILQDLGASFGPVKLDLPNWRSVPVWADPRTCRISMEQLPWGGGTFPEQTISEEGRRFLLSLLNQLSPAQLHDLYAGARVELSETVTAEGRQPAAWAAAFQDKIRQIESAGPCPPTN